MFIKKINNFLDLNTYLQIKLKVRLKSKSNIYFHFYLLTLNILDHFNHT